MSKPIIQTLNETYLNDVVHIHQQVLGYTLNSRLGDKHLSFLYRLMMQDKESYVGIILVNEKVVGFVSGTLDINIVKGKLLRSFTIGQWINILLHFLGHPWAIKDWLNGNKISQPVYVNSQKITSILNTIGIDQQYQGQGLGKKLIAELESFFRQHNVLLYHLDTLLINQSARAFYKSLGFTEFETRADSIVMIKKITHE